MLVTYVADLRGVCTHRSGLLGVGEVVATRRFRVMANVGDLRG